MFGLYLFGLRDIKSLRVSSWIIYVTHIQVLSNFSEFRLTTMEKTLRHRYAWYILLNSCHKDNKINCASSSLH